MEREFLGNMNQCVVCATELTSPEGSCPACLASPLAEINRRWQEEECDEII